MKNIAFILAAIISQVSLSMAQESYIVQSNFIRTVNSQWNQPQSYALLNEKAEQVGTYQVQLSPDKNYSYLIDYNGRKVEIDALTSVGIIPDANRIITWGSGLEVHFEYTMSYKIYDLSGNLIASKINGNNAPYRGTITKDGGLVYAARTATDDSDTSLYLQKVDGEGQIAWIRNIGIRYPQEISVSAFTGDIALMEKDWILGKSEIRIYNTNGQFITSLDHQVVSGIEFIDVNQIAVSGSGSWNIYTYSETMVRNILHGRINGNVMSLHPFLKINDDLVAVAHPWSKQLLTGFMVDIYDLNTGEIVHSIIASQDPLARRAYQCLLYDKENSVLTIRVGRQEITYSLTISK